MVRQLVNISDGADNVSYQELSGASTDTKPTDGVANGSIFVESDTGDFYMFTEPDTWTMMFSIKS